MILYKNPNYDDKVNVSIHQSPFGTQPVTYAKVQRKTTFAGNIISKVLAKSKTFDEQILFHVANLFHDAIVELLQEGKAVEVFNLGVMYLKPQKSMAGPDLSDIPDMTVCFSPSQEIIDNVKNVPIGEDVTTVREPKITSIRNLTTGAVDAFGYNHTVRINGKFLKVAGEEHQTGVFLAPSSENDFTVIGEHWIRINESDLIDNIGTQIEFSVPNGIESGTYRLLIKTAHSGGRLLRNVRTGLYENTVTVV